MTRKLELEVTVSDATIKVFSDPSVPMAEYRAASQAADVELKQAAPPRLKVVR